MRLTANLLPLLLASPQPRILSVLNGGKENALREDDLGLVHKWSPFAVIGQSTTMMTLAFDYLAAENKSITFVHAFPGLVRTNISNMVAPAGSGIMRRVYVAVVRSVVGMLTFLLGITPEASGERHAYLLTSPMFGPGVWLVDDKSEVVKGSKVLEKYRASGWPERIWEFTLSAFDRT
jgi:hypothetical protein